ncbi:MAG: hypothetical protein JNL73_22465 [Anaerolineales bacterium]|nr:hypothetical protein [Anaerolineales bacterium]
MAKKRYAVVRGRRSTDDLLSAEISSPAGQALFGCPDCGENTLIRGAGDFSCGACGSIFIAHVVPGSRTREKYLIRRKSVD